MTATPSTVAYPYQYNSAEDLDRLLLGMIHRGHTDPLLLAEICARLTFLESWRKGNEAFVAEKAAEQGRLRGYAFGISVAVESINAILNPKRKEGEVVEAVHDA